MRRHSKEEWLEIVKKEAVSRGGECLSLVYGNAHTKLDFRCAAGHVFSLNPAACAAIRREGIRNNYGGAITKDGLKRIVNSKKYEGINEVRVAKGPPSKSSKDIVREKIAEVPLEFGVVIDVGKLTTARAKLREWDSTGVYTRKRKRVYLLAGLLQHEDGSPFQGDAGTARSGDLISYYKNRKHGFSISCDRCLKKSWCTRKTKSACSGDSQKEQTPQSSPVMMGSSRLMVGCCA